MTTRLILVRHGQTQWNQEDRFRGRADISLDEKGMSQAEATAARLEHMGVSAIYSSPLRRAMQTAEPAARRLRVETRPLPGVTDIDYGSWQGLTIPQAAEHDPGVFQQWQHSPQLARFPGGESMEEARHRAAAAVASILPGHADQSIAVVSHVTICRLLILDLLSLPTSHFWAIGLSNCALSIFEFRDELPIAISINDACHLREPAS